MKVYQTNEIKNIALLGNDGSGKTTLTEALLYESGIIKRRGRITAKNTVSDYFPVEQEYGYSVFSTIFHVEWNGKKLNIIDCPGSDDFVGAAMTALNVTDTAILLLNGQYGAEVGTQNHFRYTEKLGKPVIFLVNQLDNEKCDYDMVLEQLEVHLRSQSSSGSVSAGYRAQLQLADRRAVDEEVLFGHPKAVHLSSKKFLLKRKIKPWSCTKHWSSCCRER